MSPAARCLSDRPDHCLVVAVQELQTTHSSSDCQHCNWQQAWQLFLGPRPLRPKPRTISSRWQRGPWRVKSAAQASEYVTLISDLRHTSRYTIRDKRSTGDSKLATSLRAASRSSSCARTFWPLLNAALPLVSTTLSSCARVESPIIV